MDVFLALDHMGATEFVISEVKHGGGIDKKDVSKLLRIQEWLRSQGFECLILRASLDPEISSTERRLLRQLCETAPVSLSSYQPALPIVLTSAELSAPDRSDSHPRRWMGPGDPISTLAIESCKRNLGLEDFAMPTQQDSPVTLHWREEP